MEIQLYVHIPFCLRKCAYCDFNSTAGFACPPEEYVAALLDEMTYARAELPEAVTATTLYFGGGTPSLLSPALIERVIGGAARIYGLSSAAEITLEANPGTLDDERCRAFRRAGINRISLGVQSFDDALLRTLGRVHTAGEAVQAFRAAEKAGFSGIGIDLIHSLPGQTVGMWERELREAVALLPTHLSAYSLTVEPDTPLAGLYERGELELPAEEESVAMFQRTAEILAPAGYEHYEISNFARPGFRSRHNDGYWRRRSYLGFGAGAHSFSAERGERWGNVADTRGYVASVRSGSLPRIERQQLSREDAISEHMFLGLRLLDGISCSAFFEQFGLSVEEAFPCIDEDIRSGLLVREGDFLRLDSAAIIISNQVFSRFV